MTTTAHTQPVISSQSRIFSELFHTGTFAVPWHQRRYDWTKEHVSELLQDINEAVTEERACYFLGAIMLVKKEPDTWEINDGQQRMATYSLICACFCRSFREANDSNREHHALRVLFNIGVNSTETLNEADELRPRLTPPRDDKTRYNLMIRGHGIGTNGKLTSAWREIENFISGMEQEERVSFFDFLLQRIEVACLYIPPDIDPNSVYETINSRGKQLDDLDLIRNYLYSYFNAEREKPRRDTIHDNLENVRSQLREDTKLSDYARCYFQCRYGFLPKTRFYRKSRDKIRFNAERGPTVKRPADYIYDLVSDFSRKEQVELFRVVATPSRGESFIKRFLKDSGKGNSRRNLSIFLRELATYKVTQPVVFALLWQYEKESDGRKKKRLANFVHGKLKNFTSFVMRTAFVAPKFEPSHFESEFSDFAEKVASSTSVYDIRFDEFLGDCDATYAILDDTKFTEKMKKQEMRDTKKIKRFLLGLNHILQSDSDVINEYHPTIEHILPKSKHHWQDWKEFEGINPEDWIHRIGNLTLLERSNNKPGNAENRNFSRKRQDYKRSAILLAQEIGKRDQWSPDEIDRRQEELITRATHVWSFSGKQHEKTRQEN